MTQQKRIFSGFRYAISQHENDIRCLLELLDNEELRFATVVGIQTHILSEGTQHLIDEALNLLLAQKQESVRTLQALIDSEN